MDNSIAYLSIAITLGAYIRYIIAMISKTTKPHAFSWFVWSLMTGIAFFAQRTQTQELGTRVMGMSAAMCLCIAVYGWIRYKVVIKKIDYVYLICALVSMLIRYVTNMPLRSVIFITITDMLGFLPTFRKVRIDPHGESVGVYALSALKFIFALWSFESFNLIVWLYPLYLVGANSIFVIYTLSRRWWIKRAL